MISCVVLRSAIRVVERRFSGLRLLVSAWRCFARVQALVCLAVLAAVPVAAQTAHITRGFQLVSRPGGPFNLPSGVAVDSSGNLFVTDFGNNAVYEVLAPNYTTTVPIAAVQGNFNGPSGIAIDHAGNLFVTEVNGASPIKEITAASGYVTVVTVATGFSLPTGVAVDANDNLFVADLGTVNVYELPAAGNYSTRVTLGSGFNLPTDVTVDANGNVFVADQISGVVEILASSRYTTQVALASGVFVQAGAIWVDGSDNLFVTDLAQSSAAELLAIGNYSTVIPVSARVFEGTGLTTDKSGKVFIAEQNSKAVEEYAPLPSALNFGTVPIATSTPPTLTLQFTFDTGGTIQPPAIVTQGASGQDFADAGNGSCTTNGTAHSYTPGEACSVIVSFAPKFAGNRYGAIQLRNSSGAAIVTAYVFGAGSGPQIAFEPAAETVLGSGFSVPQGVAVDGSGNVFVGDTGNNAVKMIAAASGYATVSTLGSGFSQPEGIAVDGAGNVFIADTGNDAVKEVLAPLYTTVTTLGSGFSRPTAVEVDGNGNILVNDSGNSAVKEILAAGGYTTVNTLASNFTFPSGAEAFENGNVFFADTGNNRVLKLDFTDPPSLAFAPTAVGSTSTDSPQTVTVTNDGNAPLTFPIPSAGTDAGITGSFTLSTGSTCPQLNNAAPSVFTLAVGDSCTYSVSFSPSSPGANLGSLTLTDNNLNAALPAGSMQTVALSGTAQSSQTISFSLPSPVTFGVAPMMLTATGGASGNPVVFSVVSGPGAISGNVLTIAGAGTIVIAANQAGSSGYAAATEVQQSIKVNQAAQTIQFTQPSSSVTFGASPIVLTATGGVSGNPVVFGVVSGPGTIRGSVLTVTGVGTIVVSANQAGGANYTAAAPVEQSISVSQASQTISFTLPSSVALGTPPIALSATGGASGNPVIFALVSGPGTISNSALTITGVGKVVVAANQAGNANYAAAASVQQSVTVAPTMPLVSVVSSADPGFLQNAVTLQATVLAVQGTPTGTVTFLDGATPIGSGTLTGGVAAVTTAALSAGSHSITVSYGGDGNFSAATSQSLTQIVEDFTFTSAASGGTSQTVTWGQAATFTFSASPLGGSAFPSAITLTVDGLPSGATATFSPRTLPGGSSQTPVTLTVQTPQQVAELQQETRPSSKIPPVAWGALLLPFALRLRRSGKRLSGGLSALLLFAVITAVVAGLGGCGGQTNPPLKTPQTYMVTVTATAGPLSHSANVSLTVQ